MPAAAGRILFSRRFTSKDQESFARLSGDHNPVHIDRVAARRTMFGRPIVHGVHAALWGLDRWLESRTEGVALRSLRAHFQSAIGLDEEVSCAVEPGPEHQVQIGVRAAESYAVWMTLDWTTAAGGPPVAAAPETGGPPRCRELSFEEAASAHGTLNLSLDHDRARALFPHLMRCLVPAQIAQILATTRLVGMECPGLHSVFSGLELDFRENEARPDQMSWRVIRSDRRLSLLTIEVRSAALNGYLKTLLRPSPCAQPGVEDLRRRLREGEFAGQRPLVIGGSRGLGETASKLLSAGGAHVALTFHQGAEDAHRVVDEIKGSGGTAVGLPFDVLAPPADAVSLGDMKSPTHVYYFATPRIVPGRAGSFSGTLFRNFCDHYVAGFLNTVLALRPHAPELRGVLYPSSVYVEQLPLNFAEYAAAKTAGEAAGHLLGKMDPGVTVYMPRLPRLATDQTAALLAAPGLDAGPVLLEHLRELRERAAGPRPATGR